MKVGNKKGYAYESLVRISSSERITGDNWSSSNFIYDIGQNLQLVNKVSILGVAFFNNFYNVTETNNQLNFFINGDGGGGGTVTIPIGRYTVTSLMDEILLQINSFTEGLDLTWDIDPVTNLVSITFNNGGGFTSIALFPVVSNFVLTYVGFSSSLSIDNTATAIATSFPKLYGPQEVFLNSKALWPSITTDEKGRYSDAGVAIPITAPYLGLNTWECKVDSLCEINYGKPRSLNKIDIQLMDRSNNILDLHGGSLIVILKVWFNQY